MVTQTPFPQACSSDCGAELNHCQCSSFCPPHFQGARVKTGNLKPTSERIKAGAHISVTRSFPTCSPFTAKATGLRNKAAKSMKIQVRHYHAQKENQSGCVSMGTAAEEAAQGAQTHPGQHRESGPATRGHTAHLPSVTPGRGFPQSRSCWRKVPA